MTLPRHHHPAGGFRNPWPDAAPGDTRDVLRWQAERRRNPRTPNPPPGHFPRATPAFATPRAPGDVVTATWVGHSTVLLQIGGLNVLTDPMWSARASPLWFAGPRRLTPPGVDFDALPPIDVVLQSHNHYDHLDSRTVRRMARRFRDARWFAPLGLSPLLRRWGVRDIVERDWWQTAEHRQNGRTANGPVTIGCTPAQHFSARGLRDRNRTLWCGWAVEAGGHRVFFAGDTGLHPEFAAIAERYGPFDLVLLPVGAYEPRWFMRRVHLNPEDALAAYRELRGPYADVPSPALLAIHWGTFRLTDEPADEPPQRMRALWQAAGQSDDRLWVLAHGETRAVVRRAT
ncbi:MAG: MBL fold metallo-hydrolase [Gemmatimonadota bacterium]|nr:MBL fold metallo-hydrolase [Gemmatimonadota bacterium]